MSEISINSSNLGGMLEQLLNSPDIQPGSEPDYTTCKVIYSYHPLGKKMADKPVEIAQSQEREIVIQDAPDEVIEAFKGEWKDLGADRHIFNVAHTARIYGIAVLVYGDEKQGVPTDRPIDPKDLPNLDIYFTTFDPLNVAGSLVLSQDPTSPYYQKPIQVVSQGKAYHPSRTVVVMNEQPIFIQYTQSAFGFTGRSVYQRSLFPLKSFVQSMTTDDMVTKKAGVLIEKLKQPGSIVNQLMQAAAGIKRSYAQAAQTGNVISITTEEDIETLNLMNTDTAMGKARDNIIENIASGADMPARLLTEESFAEGFGEGTEDTKHIIRYINAIRSWLQPIYKWFDMIVMYRAWTPEFYDGLKRKYPELYGKVGYAVAFHRWKNSFSARWPNLLEEPDSEKVKVAETKLRALVSMIEVMGTNLDPDNRAKLMQWVQDNVNEMEDLFPNLLNLDFEALAAYEPPAPSEYGIQGGQKPEKL